MMRRIMSMFGFSGYMPASSDFSGSGGDPDAADAPAGEARVTFLGGAKTPYSVEEADQMRRGNAEDAGEKDLVWPGKPTTIGFINQEPLAYRYNLTITNLPPTHYAILPPVGGMRQPEGGVLLQPGEETTFEVRFPPVPRTHAPVQSFHFVMTRFDPRRRNDPGIVEGEDAARWVPLPDSSDFALHADVSEVRLRPWRRSAAFRMKLEDRSFLPAELQLHILRAPTRQALQDNAESVDVISQPLEARMSGTWKCELPPTHLRNSYYATLRGAARVGEHQTIPVALPKPLYVRYVPWLRMGRDWAFLGTGLFAAVWLAWGIPVRHAPTIRMPLVFQDLPEGQLPAGGSWDDLDLRITSINDKPINPIRGVYKDKTWVFENFPAQWYGYRWPFGHWNSWGAPYSRFKVEASLADDVKDDKKEVYRKYNLGRLKSHDRNSSEFAIPASSRPFMGDWTLTPVAVAGITDGLRLNVYLDDKATLQQAVRDSREIKVMATLEGEKVLERTLTPVAEDGRTLFHDLDLPGKQAGRLKVWAVMGQTDSEFWSHDVQKQKDAYEVHLTFPGPPKTDPLNGHYRKGDPVVITGVRLGTQGDVLVNNHRVEADWSPVRVAFNLPTDTLTGPGVIDIKPRSSEQTLHVGTIDVRDRTSETPLPDIHTGGRPSGESAGSGRDTVRSRPPHTSGVPAVSSSPGSPSHDDTAQASLPGAIGSALQPIAPGGGRMPGPVATPPAPPNGPKTRPSTPVQPTPPPPVGDSPVLKSLDYYELFALDKTDRAFAAADAALQDKRARPDTLAGAHAVKGMIMLMRDQMSSRSEIDQAANISQNLRAGRGRSLALLAQARLAAKLGNQSRDQITTQFTAAATADPKMALSYSDEAEYLYSQGYNEQAEAQYRYGAIDNKNNPLFHFRFAMLFRSRSDTARQQQEAESALKAEKNTAHKQMLRGLLDNLNAS